RAAARRPPPATRRRGRAQEPRHTTGDASGKRASSFSASSGHLRFAIDNAAPAGGHVHTAEHARVADEMRDATIAMRRIVDALPMAAVIDGAKNALVSVKPAGHEQGRLVPPLRRLAETEGIHTGEAGKALLHVAGVIATQQRQITRCEIEHAGRVRRRLQLHVIVALRGLPQTAPDRRECRATIAAGEQRSRARIECCKTPRVDAITKHANIAGQTLYGL